MRQDSAVGSDGAFVGEQSAARGGAYLIFTTEALWPALEPLVQRQNVVLCEGSVAGTQSLETFGRDERARERVYREYDDAAAILYTSGTTGKQKGATLSVGNVVSNTEATRPYLRIDPNDRLLLFLPLFHVFGQNFIMNSAFAAGGALVLHRRFDRDQVLASIQRDGVMMFFAVHDLHHVAGRRHTARSALDDPLLLQCRGDDASGSVGTAIANVEMRIVDPDDNKVERGTWGEICIKGPNVMLGYWGRPEDTAEALRGGWFHTGDVGYMDDDDFVFIVDRTKDMINAAGFKVWPREVEEVLYQHPAVRECAVYGVADPVKGEVPVAAVVVTAGVSATPDEFEQFCRQRLATYKIPHSFNLVESLPKNATGKISKRLLREQTIVVP